jgi:Ca2+-binding RTX toxin-like protein
VEVTGGVQTTFAGLTAPRGLAVDNHGHLFATDAGGQVFEYTPGSFLPLQLLAFGLNQPYGVAVDSQGDLFIADSANNQVLELSNGIMNTVVAGLNDPRGVAVDSDGSLYIADTGNNRIVKVAPDGSQTTVGSGLNGPWGVMVDSGGDVFVPDTGNARVVEEVAGVRVTVSPLAVTLGGNRSYDSTTTAAAGILSITNLVGGDNVTLSGDVTLAGINAGPEAISSFAHLTLGGSAAGNYTLTGASGSVNIAARPITVTANPQAKTAGDADPPLTYQITAGNLVGNDAFSGCLMRDPGEAAGAYTIGQGSLTAGSNYALTFVNSVLLITATSDPLQSGQTVGVSSTAAGTASTTPASTGAAQLSATGAGFDGALTVAQYQGAPVSGFNASGSYFDVNVGSSDLGAGSSVQVTFIHLMSGAAVFWFNGSAWQPVTDAAGNIVTADTSGTAMVKLTTASSPSLGQLGGTDFFAGAFHPTLTATAGPTAVVGTGVPLSATATLAAGNNEAGKITFTLYGPSGKPVDVETASVSGNGAYATPTGFLPTVAGTYQWVAAYSGDSSSAGTSTVPGSTPEVAVGAGATVVGNVLYLVGGNTNDQVNISFAGSSQTGSTGIQVNAKLNGVNTNNVTFGQSPSTPITTVSIVGFSGNDNIQLSSTLTIATVISLGNGNDNVQLGGGNNVVTVGNGNDNIQAGSGNNVVTVGNGNDNIQLGAGTNTVTLGNGNDNIQAGSGNNIVTVGNGNDNVQLGGGNNTVTLGNGNNNIQAGSGTNVVTAGNGNDYVQLGSGNNIVTVGNGNDNIKVGNGNNVVVEGTGNDNVQAGNGDNLIVGGLGKHTIQAGNGSNILIDGSVQLLQSGDTLEAVLNDWIASGAAAASSIRSRLKVTENTKYANNIQAGSGLDWFWYTYAQDHTNRKSTDLLN